jgi:hypothetical protein
MLNRASRVLAAILLGSLTAIVPVLSQDNRLVETPYEFNDANFHLTNYIQEGTAIRDFLAIMGNRTGRSVLFGIPLQQEWSYRISGDNAPTYYLHTDAPLYYYSFTDADIAMPRLDIYGFVMTDFGYDVRSNDPNWFDVVRPTKLPSFQDEFGRSGRTFAGVRQTRFGVKGSEQTPLGELKTQFEFDMFGVGPDAGQTTIRPRHYYAELGAFGAGQTNSPFMDIDIFPNIPSNTTSLCRLEA